MTPYQGDCVGSFVLKIQSGGRPSILQGDCFQKNIYKSGHKHLARGNRVVEKEGFLVIHFRII
jgi:hypothetical protein